MSNTKSNKWTPPIGSYAILVIPLTALHYRPVCFYDSNGGYMEALRNTMKVVTGYHFDGGHENLSHNGKLFSFSVRRHNPPTGSIRYKELKSKYGKTDYVFEFSLWDQTGTQSLLNIEFIINDISGDFPESVLDEIREVCDNYLRGKVNCSDCRKEVKANEIAGRYFASQYCPSCWHGVAGEHKGKGGWREVEAKETYE